MRIAGIDVGKKSDPSAFVRIDGDITQPRRMIVGCDVLPLKMRYTEQIAQMSVFSEQADLVVVDGTGVGEAVVDFLRERYPDLPVWSVMITGGKKVTMNFDHKSANAPKSGMIAHVANCIEKGVVGHDIEDHHQQGVLNRLWREMATFVSKGRRIEAAFGNHDDLVMALALALFGFAIKHAEIKRAA